MRKLPSALTIANRSVKLQNRLFKLTRRYADLLPRYELARKAYDVADEESEELYLASRELEKVPFWDEMKDDLFIASEKAYDRGAVLGEQTEDLEHELLDIENAITDAYGALKIRW